MTQKTTTKEKDTIASLIARLDDPQIENRHHAVRALAEHGDRAVKPLGLTLAAAKDADHRWYAAIALRK